MTILETLIAMFLLSILLVMVFAFFRELAVINRLTEKEKKEAFEWRYAESRLAYLFERIVNEKATDRLFYFYVDPPNGNFSSFPSLVFTFNNEIRRDPAYSGDVLGRLYLNKQNQLILATWPLIKENPTEQIRQEILLNEVEEIKFLLYTAPEQTKKNEMTIEKVDPEALERNQWHENRWPHFKEKNKREMPTILKILVNMQDQSEIEFAFVLPSSKHPIFYPSNDEGAL